MDVTNRSREFTRFYCGCMVGIQGARNFPLAVKAFQGHTVDASAPIGELEKMVRSRALPNQGQRFEKPEVPEGAMAFSFGNEAWQITLLFKEYEPEARNLVVHQPNDQTPYHLPVTSPGKVREVEIVGITDQPKNPDDAFSSWIYAQE